MTAVDVFLLAGGFPGTSHAGALANARSYAIAAEDAGFDKVWIAEHHFLSYGVCPSATTMAGYLLGRTERIGVGTAAVILPNRHPVALAEEAVLLDELSGGRFELGVARGGPWVDLEVFGTGLDAYQGGFTESLDLLLRWLSGDDMVGADGDRFTFRPVRTVPRPRRPISVRVAATSAGSARLAASRGLPLLTGMHTAPEATAELLAEHAAESALNADSDAETASGTGTDVHRGRGHASAHLAYVADSDADAEGALRAAMPGWLATTGEYVRIDGSTGPARDPNAYLEHLIGIHPVGTPDRCVERLRHAVQVTGVERLLLMVEGAGTPERTLANIRRLGAEVLPHL